MTALEKIKKVCFEGLVSEMKSTFNCGNTYGHKTNAFRFELNFDSMTYLCTEVHCAGEATMSCSKGFKGDIPEDLVDILKVISYEGNSICSILIIQKHEEVH